MKKMITYIENCGIRETEELICYLEKTPVKELANLLRSKNYELKKGNITSIEDIGSLKTKFGELGEIQSIEVFNRDKFLVKEVIPILMRTENHSNKYAQKALNEIKEFIIKDKADELEYKISIFQEVNAGYVIEDGNKRSIAFYERRKTNEKNISFPIYLIDRSDQKL